MVRGLSLKWLPLSLSVFLLLPNVNPTSFDLAEAVAGENVTDERVWSKISGQQLFFSRVADRLLDGKYSTELRLRFASASTFDTRRFQLGLQGRYECNQVTASEDALRWEKQTDGAWELVVSLDSTTWAQSKGFGVWLAEYQRKGGSLLFWIQAPFAVRQGSLRFYPSAPDLIPTVKNLRFSPDTYIKQSRDITASFESDAPVSRYQCSLDSKAWADCRSPSLIQGLSDGWHSFTVRAFSLKGRQGPAVGQWIYIQVPPASVTITKIDPTENPTELRTKKFWFKPAWNWGANSAMQCRLDNGPYQNCSSPYAFTNLTPGEHTAEFRQIAYTWYWLRSMLGYWSASTGYPAVHRWTVSDESAKISWVKTPAEQVSSLEQSFEFSANRAVEFRCSVDGHAASVCTSPFVVKDLEEGVHSVEVQAWLQGVQKDAIGFRYLIDRTAPVLSWLSLEPAEALTSRTDFSGQVEVSEPATLACLLDEKALASCPNPFVLEGLKDGRHSFEVRATDAVGNQSSLKHEWEIDSRSPLLSVRLVSPIRNPSSETSAQIEFSADESSRFLCVVDGASEVSCVSPLVLQNLSDGAHQVVISALDPTGNRSQVSEVAWGVDTRAPKITRVTREPGENPTISRSASVSFEADEEVTFFCRFNSGEKSECVSPWLGNHLMDGQHQIEITAVDRALNSSSVSTETWVVAATAHVALDRVTPATSPTNQRDIRFEFTANAVESFQCQLDGGGWKACSSPMSYSGVTDGEHLFQVRALNAIGEEGPEVQYTWQVDATAPILTMTQFEPSGLVDSTQARATFTTNETATVRCRVDNSEWSICASPWQVTDLFDGPHVAEFYAEDMLGNRSEVISRTWTVDTEVPIVNLISFIPATSLTVVTKMEAKFSSRKSGVTFECSVDGVTSVCTSPFIKAGLLDGAHLFSVRAKDSLGRYSEPVTRLWAVDTVAPTVQLGTPTPAEKLTSSTSISLPFSVSESATKECSLDGAAMTACTSPVSYQGLVEGNHTISVRARDAAGNLSSTVSYSWSIDTTAPVLKIISLSPAYTPTSKTALTVTFDAGDSTQVFCSLDGAAFNTCSSPWAITGLSAGNHRFEIYGKDAVGLESNRLTYSWKVDTTALSIDNVAVTLVSANSAVLSWTTNLAASSSVEYGEGTTLDKKATATGSDVTVHTVTVTGLSANTLYRAKAVSVDKDGRSVESSVVSFRTLR